MFLSGKAIKELPPPEIRKITKSFFLVLSNNEIIAFAAFTLLLSGTGCEDSMNLNPGIFFYLTYWKL